MKPDELSRQLRKGSGPFLARRRGIVGLSLVSINAMGLIALYQMGIIDHLPEPPIAGLNADKVDASGEAYAYFSTPDAFIGLGSYAVTMGLAAMGGADRATQRPWIPLALAAKVLVDAAQAGKLTVDQWTKHRTTRSASGASLPRARPSRPCRSPFLRRVLPSAKFPERQRDRRPVCACGCLRAAQSHGLRNMVRSYDWTPVRANGILQMEGLGDEYGYEQATYSGGPPPGLVASEPG